MLLSSALADLGLCFKMVDKHLFTMQCVPLAPALDNATGLLPVLQTICTTCVPTCK